MQQRRIVILWSFLAVLVIGALVALVMVLSGSETQEGLDRSERSVTQRTATTPPPRSGPTTSETPAERTVLLRVTPPPGYTVEEQPMSDGRHTVFLRSDTEPALAVILVPGVGGPKETYAPFEDEMKRSYVGAPVTVKARQKVAGAAGRMYSSRHASFRRSRVVALTHTQGHTVAVEAVGDLQGYARAQAAVRRVASGHVSLIAR